MVAKGKEFEELIECISRCLHKRATITPNDKVIDINTGQKREVDISIRMNDGPTHFFAMVEVRDRSRKVGVDFVEQIRSKRDAIQADKAIIVSKVGFAATSVEKAKAYHIETYSLAEALKSDWSQMFALFREFVTWSYPAKVTMYFIDDSMKIIDLREDLVNKVAEGDQDVQIIFDENGLPKMRGSQFLQGILNDPRVRTLVDSDPDKTHQVKLRVPLEGENMYVRDHNDNLIHVKEAIVAGFIWREIKTYEPVVRQYKDEKTGEVIAEVVGANDPSFQFEVIAEYPDRVGTERRIFMRRKAPPTLGA